MTNLPHTDRSTVLNDPFRRHHVAVMKNLSTHSTRRPRNNSAPSDDRTRSPPDT